MAGHSKIKRCHAPTRTDARSTTARAHRIENIANECHTRTDGRVRGPLYRIRARSPAPLLTARDVAVRWLDSTPARRSDQCSARPEADGAGQGRAAPTSEGRDR